MTAERIYAETPYYVSIAIFAWNEEKAIGSALGSLFAQSFFGNLDQRHLRCEVVCVLNGCTDQTAEVAQAVFDGQEQQHPFRRSFSCRVVNLSERGKLNAWNQFVHSVSAREAQFLILMDADILIHARDTLWNMLTTLEGDPEASVTVDRPCKDILFKKRKSFPERLSAAASQITGAASAQLCAQLYCIRAEVARNIYLPRDLAACEDGYIKALVCTDSLTRPLSPSRIRLAQRAEHTFEAYLSLGAILRNQKRQMIGQTIVHILVDNYLKELPLAQRQQLAQTLREKEMADPAWLKRLISQHLQRTRFFWRLFPGVLSHRFSRLRALNWTKRLVCLPAALASSFVAAISSYMAHQTLKQGSTDYWPQAQRTGLKPVDTHRARGLQLTAAGNKQE